LYQQIDEGSIIVQISLTSTKEVNVHIYFRAYTYSDSKIACKFCSARTKTSSLITGVLAPHSVDIVRKEIEENVFFGIATDASTQVHQDFSVNDSVLSQK
jgi:sRNA-binding carbon storage regulator CsrA